MRLVPLLCSVSIVVGLNIVDTAIKTAVYRAISHALPADRATLTLAGAKNIIDANDQVVRYQHLHGFSMANNMRESFAVRSFWYDQHIEKAVLNGNFEQMVILGAGFDTRCFRMNCLKDITVFEVDCPAVIKQKTNILDQNDFRSCAKKVVRIAAELSERALLAAMMANGFRHEAKTIFVMEGTLYTLSDKSANQCLRLPLLRQGNVVLFDIATTDLNSDDCGELDFIRFGIDDPEKYLSRMGYGTTTVDQFGDENANFGALNTNVANGITGYWGFKFDRRVTDIEGLRIQRFYLVKSETQ